MPVLLDAEDPECCSDVKCLLMYLNEIRTKVPAPPPLPEEIEEKVGQLVWCGVVWFGVVWCGVVWLGSMLRELDLLGLSWHPREYPEVRGSTWEYAGVRGSTREYVGVRRSR